MPKTGRPRLLRCKRGHDTSDCNSRTSGNACKKCAAENSKRCKSWRWGAKKEYNASYRASPAGKAVQFKHALKKSGWTPGMWEQAMKEQGNLCAMCKKPFTEDNHPSADHSHESMKPRGILHRNCNGGLGLLEDDPELLRLGIAYLEVWA
jgi:hypothetical protein